MRRAAALITAGFCFGLPSQAADQIFFHPETVTPIGSHVCGGFYPAAAREANIGGVATLGFHIGTNGTVSNVVVAKSSGNADLDDAAKSCVRTWLYSPVLKDGKAVEAAWTAEVEFKVAAPAAAALPFPVLVEQDRHACNGYPHAAFRDHAEGNAAIKYTVTPEGQVADPVMTKSSGNADLDEAAMSCVKSMKYRPHSGGDANRPAAAQVTWSYLPHAPSVIRWSYVGIETTQGEGLREITASVSECLKGAAGHSEFAAGFRGATMLRAHYWLGEIKDVSVLRTSGSDALDRYAADCYRAEPFDRDRAKAMSHVGNSTFVVPWPRYVNP